MQPLIDLLKTGFFHLKTQEAELKERAQANEKTGYAPRLKQSSTNENSTVVCTLDTIPILDETSVSLTFWLKANALTV